jgi:hypothetical protein
MRPSIQIEKELKRKESERLVAEYFAKGGQVHQVPLTSGEDPYGKSWKDRPRSGVTSMTIKEKPTNEHISSD